MIKKIGISRNWIVGLILLFYTSTANAQVVIGSLNPPKQFSVLEIVSTTGGLRLPQFTPDERNALTALVTAKHLAKGLMIFYVDDATNTREIQYWNGTEWISFTENSENISSSDLIVDGENAVLSPMTINVNEGAITLDKLAGETEKIDETYEGKVYVTDEVTGAAKLANKSEVINVFSPNNGLSGSLTALELGGNLTENTRIDMEVNNFELGSTGGKFKVDSALVITNAEGGMAGIARDKPETTLDIAGAIATGETSVIAEGTTVALPNLENIGQVVIKGTPSGTFTITGTDGGKIPGVSGQSLVINNTTLKTAKVSGYSIDEGQVRKFIYSNGDWRATTTPSTIKRIYTGAIKFPRHNSSLANAQTKCNTKDWKIVSVSSVAPFTATSANLRNASATMNIIYEYQGVPFDLTGLYPVFTAVNQGRETFNVAYFGLTNDPNTKKTKLSLKIVRTDKLQAWGDIPCYVNVLIVNSTK